MFTDVHLVTKLGRPLSLAPASLPATPPLFLAFSVESVWEVTTSDTIALTKSEVPIPLPITSDYDVLSKGLRLPLV